MRWRHVRRGTIYTEVGRAKLQTNGSVFSDMQPIVVYRSEGDGSLWVRSTEEFEDGRFERLDESRGLVWRALRCISAKNHSWIDIVAVVWGTQMFADGEYASGVLLMFIMMLMGDLLTWLTSRGR